MSHEIRTPLNGVLGVAALMEKKLEQEELRPYVRTVIDSGQSLLRLLTDALDMSRASAGMLTLEEEPLNLSAVAFDIDALWRARAEEKALSLTVRTEFEASPWVRADGMRIKQLLNNLVGNALKFTQSGGVIVTLSSHATRDGVRVELTVDDSGPGVPETAAATIFEPFNIGKAGREGAGAGLGLAICRQIAERMDGGIGLSVSPQGGARFHVVLPLTACAAEEAAAAAPMAEPTPHETLHVLVVDDNAANRFVAAKLLEMFNCTVELAENGQEALDAVSNRPFDLALMDIKMPVMDGIAATRAIRALPGPAARLPILALTANADERDELDYVAAGMNGVAQKPIQPDALLNAIRLVLAETQSEATPVEAEAA
ncbi:response regulator [Brevundimonas aurantiaca]|nr:response regulator [Brevundimonas aurantiaca]